MSKKPTALFFFLLLFGLLAARPVSSPGGEYAAMVNQYGVGAPSADEVYIDNIGATLVYTRTEAGHYIVTSTPCVFAYGKTYVQAGAQWGSPVIVGISQMNPCEVWVEVYKVVNGAIVLSDYWGIQVFIRVYP